MSQVLKLVNKYICVYIFYNYLIKKLRSSFSDSANQAGPETFPICLNKLARLLREK